MKISFLVYNIYGMGGTVRTVVNTANYFAAQNLQVEIISVRKTAASPMFSINSSVKIKPLFDARRGKRYYKGMPLHKKLFKKIACRLPSVAINKKEDLYHMFTLFTDIKVITALRQIKSDILITTIPSFNVLATLLAPKRVKTIGQEHRNFDIHDVSLQRKIIKHYPKLDVLTCLTDNEVNAYRELLKTSNVKVIKVENATDMQWRSASLEEKTIIAAGRYVPEKGFDLLIPAFVKVIETHPEWKLKIFGSGKDEPLLRDLIFKYKAYNNILLMPTTNKITEEMLRSSAYVLSSRSESFGMVLIEAMSVGLPCISYKCPGPVEILKNEEDGLLVDEEDIQGLAEAMNRIIGSVDLRHELGKQAKINVERYSFIQIGQKWKLIIDELNQEHKREPQLEPVVNFKNNKRKQGFTETQRKII
ncbi:glycosyltransferase family 4 protein [Bacillus sp. JCM 19041]|uniref:glycosyltransferase family 4 protein n=1 Tax=Bacillus sp. JCM 19041 TaxID=1460637 RepID=UPI0006D0BD0E